MEARVKRRLSGRELNGNLVLGGILAQNKFHSLKVMSFAKGHSFIKPVKLLAVLEEFRFASVAFDEHFRVTASQYPFHTGGFNRKPRADRTTPY